MDLEGPKEHVGQRQLGGGTLLNETQEEHDETTDGRLATSPRSVRASGPGIAKGRAVEGGPQVMIREALISNVEWVVWESLRRVLGNRMWLLLAGLLLGIVTIGDSQNAVRTPGSGNWNTASNWTPSTGVPTGIAEFGSATTTTLTFSNSASVGTLQFDAGAPAYSFNLATSSVFNITGAGIVNNSSNVVTLTTSNGGGLQFQNSSTAGSSILITGSGGTTLFGNTSTGGQARAITSAGGIFDISGLTSGGMTIGSIEGAGTYKLGSKVLTIGNSLSTILTGNVIDAGSFPGVGGGLVKVGTSTLTLSGIDTYTGSTVISAGTLQAGSVTGFSSTSALTDNAVLDLAGFSNSVASLAGTGTVTNSGAVAAILTAGGNATNTTFSGNLTDGASSLGLSKVGTGGTLTLSGTNTYSGATTVSAGTLQAGSVAAFSANSDFTVNGTLDLNGLSNSVGSLAGTGTVTNSVAGTKTLTAGGDNASSVFGGILSNGAGVLTLTKTGTGTLTLTGANTLTGGTTIGAGTLQIGNGTTGSISGNIADNANLAFARSNSTTYSGLISGAGTLAQNGVGTLILSGLSTAFTGATTVNAGTLEVDGKLGTAASSVNVLSGAALAGQGTIGGSVLIQNGGILGARTGIQRLEYGSSIFKLVFGPRL